MRRSISLVSLIVVLLAGVAAAQIPKYRSSKGYVCGQPCYHFHVVKGTPGRYIATAGEWIDVHADLRTLPKGAKFSSWLLRKDVKVADVNDPDTKIQMPARDTDIGWTWYTGGK